MSRDPDTTGTAGIPRQDALRPDGSGGSSAPLVPPPPVDRRGFLFKLGLAINAVAAAVWGALFTSLGYVFGTGIAELLGRYRPHGRQWLWVAGAAVLLGGGFAAFRWWRSRRA